MLPWETENIAGHEYSIGDVCISMTHTFTCTLVIDMLSSAHSQYYTAISLLREVIVPN